MTDNDENLFFSRPTPLNKHVVKCVVTEINRDKCFPSFFHTSKLDHCKAFSDYDKQAKNKITIYLSSIPVYFLFCQPQEHYDSDED